MKSMSCLSRPSKSSFIAAVPFFLLFKEDSSAFLYRAGARDQFEFSLAHFSKFGVWDLRKLVHRTKGFIHNLL
jgi:hypothetical protein